MDQSNSQTSQALPNTSMENETISRRDALKTLLLGGAGSSLALSGFSLPAHGQSVSEGGTSLTPQQVKVLQDLEELRRSKEVIYSTFGGADYPVVPHTQVFCDSGAGFLGVGEFVGCAIAIPKPSTPCEITAIELVVIVLRGQVQTFEALPSQGNYFEAHLFSSRDSLASRGPQRGDIGNSDTKELVRANMGTASLMDGITGHLFFEHILLNNPFRLPENSGESAYYLTVPGIMMEVWTGLIESSAEVQDYPSDLIVTADTPPDGIPIVDYRNQGINIQSGKLLARLYGKSETGIDDWSNF